MSRQGRGPESPERGSVLCSASMRHSSNVRCGDVGALASAGRCGTSRLRAAWIRSAIASAIIAVSCSGCALVDKRYPPIDKPSVQNHMTQQAQSSLDSMQQVDAFFRFNNEVLASQIRDELVRAATEDPSLDIARVNVAFGDQVVVLGALVDFLDEDSGKSIRAALSGDLVIVLGGNSLIWLPHFSHASVEDTDFSFGGELFKTASSLLLDRFLNNINGELIRGIILDGKNAIPIRAAPLSRLDIAASLAQTPGLTAKSSFDLGGVFTVVGSSVLIERDVTSVAVDFSYVPKIANCPAGLSISRAAFASSIEDREPKGIRRGVSVGEDVQFFFSEVTGAKEGSGVYHYWFADGAPVAAVELEVGASPTWRTWSSKQLQIGPVRNWEVLVVDKDTGCIVASDAIQTDPRTEKVRPTTAQVASASYENFRSSFRRKVSGFPTASSEPQVASVEVRRTFFEDVLNSALHDIRLELVFDTKEMPRANFAGYLDPFNHESISCTQRDCRKAVKRDCTADFGNCKLSHDDRSCRRGGMIKYNDPFCEAAKAAQNTGYRIARETCVAKEKGRKLNCERIKAQEIAGCTVETAARKTTCEAGKEVVKRAELQGPLAKVRGHADTTGLVKGEITNFSISQGLSRIEFDLSVKAELKLNGDMRFVPQGILGPVATCLSAWKESYDSTVIMPPMTHHVVGTITQGPESLAVGWSTHEFKVSMSPAPVEAIFVDNPHLLANCAIGLSISSIASALSGDGSEFFTGGYRFDVEPRDSELELGTMEVELGEERHVGSPSVAAKHIRYDVE